MNLNNRIEKLLINIKKHLNDPKGRSEMETAWLKEINIILIMLKEDEIKILNQELWEHN